MPPRRRRSSIAQHLPSNKAPPAKGNVSAHEKELKNRRLSTSASLGTELINHRHAVGGSSTPHLKPRNLFDETRPNGDAVDKETQEARSRRAKHAGMAGGGGGGGGGEGGAAAEPQGTLAVYFGIKEGKETNVAITDSTVITDDAGQGGESNANPCIKFITLREDPLYKPFITMLEHGIPLPSVYIRASKAEGVDPDLLLIDPDEPSPNQRAIQYEAQQEEILTEQLKDIEENFKWRAHGMDWKQTRGVNTIDAPVLPPTEVLMEQQDLERERQRDIDAERSATKPKDDGRLRKDVNDIGPSRITAEDLRIDKMRRNFPRMYTQPNFMYKAVGTAGGSDDMCFDHGLDLRFEQARDVEDAARVARSGSPSSARSEGSWSSDGSGDRKSKPTKPKYGVREGSLTGVTKSWGVLGGFSLATETRFPIVTKSQEEIDAFYARGKANAK